MSLRGFGSNLGAYGVSVLGLAALLPASGRLLTAATDWASRRG